MAVDYLKHSAKEMYEEVDGGVDPRILNLDTKMRELSAQPPPRPNYSTTEQDAACLQSLTADKKRKISSLPAIENRFPDHPSHNLVTSGELSYLAPLGSENISAPYFKQCFFRGGGRYYPPDSQTSCLPVPRQK